jgi:hypothetical protein
MSQEVQTEQGVEEAGWEDLNAHGTGETDHFAKEDDDDFEPVASTEETTTEETTEAAAAEETTDAEDATAPETDTEPEGTTAETVTLDGVKYEVPEGELGEAFKKAATHFNQVNHFQELAEKSKADVAELKEQNQTLMNQFTNWQMQQQQQQQQQQAEAAQPPQQERPLPQQLQGAFRPYIEALKEQGRLSEDELEEHSGLISEYLYDQVRTTDTIRDLAVTIDERLRQLEGVAVPTYEANARREAEERDRHAHSEVAAMEGYEALKDPEEWGKLKQFVAEKVMNSPRDQQGNPLFDPIFDGPTMAQQYDAMQGAIMRKALAEQKILAEQKKTKQTQQAAGNAPGGGGKPQTRPKPKVPAELTPEDDALDFSDPNRAIG